MWPVIVEIPIPFTDLRAPIRSFGLMVVIAFLAATGLMRRLCEREKTATRDDLERLFFYELFAVVLGSRALYVLTSLGEFRGRWFDVIRIDKGGMVMYGGLIAVVAVGLWYLRRRKLPVWRIADVGAVAGALGLGIGRIGCLLVGDDYGAPCSADFPLGIKFPTPTAPGSLWGLTIPADNGNLAGRFQGVWLHPAQIYMSVNGFLMALALYTLWKRKRFHGQVLAAFILLKAVTRGVIEEFRGDEDRGFVSLGFWTPSTSQFVGALTAVGAVVLWIVLSRRPELRVRDRAQAAAPAEAA
ncbi:MAG TPA: prolipoprotein diacylglyceryl transferase [Planctomycetota bacterium]|nr:prolipoprotein diacylglyceryl transferase [Planctomycetota bacterium]